MTVTDLTSDEKLEAAKAACKAAGEHRWSFHVEYCVRCGVAPTPAEYREEMERIEAPKRESRAARAVDAAWELTTDRGQR